MTLSRLPLFGRLVVICGVIAAVSMSARAGAPPYDEKSIVQIMTVRTDSSERGTGFVIDGDRIVTAYHVIEGATTIRAVGDDLNTTAIEIEAVAPDRDLAFLKLTDARLPALPVATAELQTGDAVYLIGFPGGLALQQFAGTLSSVKTDSSRTLRDNAGKRIILPDLDLLTLDILAEEGLSGAPLLSASGEVVGVLSGSLRVGRDIAWAIPVKYIRDGARTAVNKAAIDYTPPAFRFTRPDLDLSRSRMVAQPSALWNDCVQAYRTAQEVTGRASLAISMAYFRTVRPALAPVNAPEINGAAVDMDPAVHGGGMEAAAADIERACTEDAWLEALRAEKLAVSPVHLRAVEDLLAARKRAGPVETVTQLRSLAVRLTDLSARPVSAAPLCRCEVPEAQASLDKVFAPTDDPASVPIAARHKCAQCTIIRTAQTIKKRQAALAAAGGLFDFTVVQGEDPAWRWIEVGDADYARLARIGSVSQCTRCNHVFARAIGEPLVAYAYSAYGSTATFFADHPLASENPDHPASRDVHYMREGRAAAGDADRLRQIRQSRLVEALIRHTALNLPRFPPETIQGMLMGSTLTFALDLPMGGGAEAMTVGVDLPARNGTFRTMMALLDQGEAPEATTHMGWCMVSAADNGPAICQHWINSILARARGE